jgi:uncharacterized protein (TIGR02217 family)
MGNAVLPTFTGVKFSVLRKPRGGATLVQTSVSGKETRIALWSMPINDFELSYEYLRQTQPYATIGAVPFPSAIRNLNGLGGYIMADDWQALEGFFKARQGAFDDFLFEDVYTPDNTVTNMQFGTGDGSAATFQLTRTLGPLAEQVQNVAGVVTGAPDTPPTIYIGGVAQATSTYSISQTGMVTFRAAPGSGAVLSWTGSYYWRVRFAQDVNDFELFLHNFFRLRKMELTGIKL